MADEPAEGVGEDSHTARRELIRGVDRQSIMVAELLSGILVWGGVGWVLDRWLATEPWLFAIGVLVGFGAGLYLVWVRSGAAHLEEQARMRAVIDRDRRRRVEQEGPVGAIE